MPDYYELNEPKACKALLAEYVEANDPIVQFVQDVVPELAWNKIPQKFLYDLFIAWSKRNNPSGMTAGRNTFIQRIRDYINNGTITGWVYNPGKVCINQGDNQNQEHMILDYGLYWWQSPTYKGCDPSKTCMTDFAPSYKGVLVKT